MNLRVNDYWLFDLALQRTMFDSVRKKSASYLNALIGSGGVSEHYLYLTWTVDQILNGSIRNHTVRTVSLFADTLVTCVSELSQSSTCRRDVDGGVKV